MRNLFAKLNEILANGNDTVFVSIVTSTNSNLYGSNAHMIVTAKGCVYGTIGGGAIERKSEHIALDILRNSCSCIEHIGLNVDDINELGLTNDVTATVFFHFIPGNSHRGIGLAKQIEKLYEQGEEAWLICEMTSGSDGMMSVYGKESGIFGDHVPQEVIEKLGSNSMKITVSGGTYYCEQLKH